MNLFAGRPGRPGKNAKTLYMEKNSLSGIFSFPQIYFFEFNPDVLAASNFPIMKQWIARVQVEKLTRTRPGRPGREAPAEW